MKLASRRVCLFGRVAGSVVAVLFVMAAVQAPSAGAGTSVTGPGLRLPSALGALGGVPEVVGLSPSQAQCGEPAFTLTVIGTGFVAGSVVLWNGSPRDTGVVSASVLTATVRDSDVAEPGVAYVTVKNPEPGGGQSGGARVFTILARAPEITGIAPRTVWSGGGDFELSVAGEFFGDTSVVQIAGVDAPTTVVSSQRLQAVVPARLIRYAASLSVRVYTPPPGGGLSELLFLEVVDDYVPPVTRAEGLKTTWNRVPVTLKLVATDEGRGVEKTFYRVDGGQYDTGNTVRIPAPSNHSNDGMHLLQFFSVDKLLNFEEPPKSLSVGIDTVPPKTSVAAATAKAGGRFAVRYLVYDALSPTARDALLQIVDRSGDVVQRVSLGKPKTRTWHTAAGVEADLAPGVYRMRVLAHDLAGNAQAGVKSAALTVR